MVSEAVLYISARSELLCGFFLFLSIGCLATALRVEREDEAGSWPWRLGAILACAGAIASKETGMMGPIVLAAVELSLGGARERTWWKRIRWHYWAPLIALVAFGVGLRLQRILSSSPDAPDVGLLDGMGSWSGLLPAEVDRDMGVQLTTSAEVWRRYLGLWLMPVGQTIRHGQADLAPGSAGGLLAVGIWLGLVYGCWRLWKQNRVAGLAIFVAGLSLVPSTSFIPLNEHMAEHRSYQFGLFLLLGLAWAVPSSWLRPLGSHITWVAGVLSLGLISASLLRVEVWSSEAGLWQESSERVGEGESRSEIARRAFQTGTVLRLEGQLEEAKAELNRAIEFGDSTDRVWLEDGEHGLLYASWNELGIVHATLGDGVGAQEAFEEAIRIDPAACRAQNNLGGLQFNQGRTELARRIYMDSLAYCSDDAVALFMLGRIHYQAWKMAQEAGDPVDRQDILRDQAQEFFQRLEKIHPRFAQVEQVKTWLLELTFHQ
jgi:hypothetical protein